MRNTTLPALLALALFAVPAMAQTKAKPAAKPQTAPPASTIPGLDDPTKHTAKAPETFKVQFETSKGNFTIAVTRKWSPLGADRFYNLVRAGFFTDVIFFRVVPDFVVQFGIHGNPKFAGKWLEANIDDDTVVASNKRGYITYAKSSAPNSRSTQLFINLKDNTRLDQMGFSPFGQVVSGMEVVDKLYGGYGEQVTQLQGEIAQQGNKFLEKNFPELDKIKKATIVK
jgi:peptidyl-prolyl cis-trans isomerase A (cyclophilin A)